LGGLVQQEKVCRADEDTGQRVAIAFTAGGTPSDLEGVVAGEEKAAQQPAQIGLRNTRSDAADVIQHAGVRIEHFVLVLREVFGK